MPLFDSDFLTKLEYLSIVSKKVFRGQIVAQRRTMQVGNGIEFADHRPYTAGDDFRYLDWNLYARHDELLLKRFQEEQDLHVYLLLDCSRSMTLGDPPRFDVARQVAAALAYIALADLDRVSVLAFADGVLKDFPLTRGKSRILGLMKFLEELKADGPATRLTTMAQEFVRRKHRRGIVIVLSDFYDPNGFEEGLDLLRHHQYEPGIVQFHLPEEADPGLLGDVELQDVESGGVRKMTVTEQQLGKYQEVFTDFLDSLRRYCSKYGLECTITNCTEPYDRLVLSMMGTTGSR